MAHLLFCSRLWCTFEEEDRIKMVSNQSEVIIKGNEK